jgi:hypothetical protein
MKILLLAALLGTSAASAAPDSSPFENKCTTAPMRAKIQKAIIKDLRAMVEKEQEGYSAYDFHFTHPVRLEADQSFGIAVYFETLGEEQETRRGHVGQFALDPQSCAPTFKKKQLLVGGTDASVDRLSGMMDKEICNYGDGQDAIIKDTVRNAKWMAPQQAPGSTVTSFAFTGVTRVSGTGDVAAIYETSRPGQLSTPILVLSNVDEKTCKPKLRISTSFDNTILDY